MKKQKKILVVDDEKAIVETIKAYLEKENFLVYSAYDGKEALTIFKSNNPDLVVLDLMIPEISGEEVCRIIREESNIPIIMLSAKISENSKLNGFSLGTDDYMTKPFSLKELVARIHSIFKRINDDNHDIVSFNDDDLKIDFDGHVVEKNGQVIRLTPNEFKLLTILVKNHKRAFSRNELITLGFDDAYDVYERTIDSHIKNLRAKIEDQNNSYIVTVRGFGYRFEASKGHGDIDEI